MRDRLRFRTDRRPGRTRAALLAALEDLLTESRYGVTVRRLTERANVNRVTFYLHFRSLSDFITTVTCEKVESLEASLCPGRSIELLEHIKQHSALYRYALCQAASPFHPRILNSLMKSLRRPLDLQSCAAAGAAIGVVAWWLTSGTGDPPKEVARRLESLIP